MDAISSVKQSIQKPQHSALAKVAKELEASFLTEMLKSAGLGETRQAFGGGAGEEHFSAFLVREYSDLMVSSGGIGLAESIYDSLVNRETAG